MGSKLFSKDADIMAIISDLYFNILLAHAILGKGGTVVTTIVSRKNLAYRMIHFHETNQRRWLEKLCNNNHHHIWE